MSRPEDPHDPAEEQRTRALPRPALPPPDPNQETTVLRRPVLPPGPAQSNLPGSQRGPWPTPPPAPPPARPAPTARTPRKVTVMRVAALRSKELTHRGLVRFHGAVSADGADQSGLGHLIYAVMANYAVDAALAVALANTLFFAAASAESADKVLLYLLLTVAPFAVVAPLIGPLLDRLQRGRRIALAASSFGRATLAVIMALNFDSWIIYPGALGMLVLSKSFGVLKAALTPRVLPRTSTLVKTNSRLSVFGLIAGGVSGGIAIGIAAIPWFGSAGALWFTAACGIVGGWLCLRIPAWVESTEGEVPVQRSGRISREEVMTARGPRRPGVPRAVVATIMTNATIRLETGFFTLFIAFVIKNQYQSDADATTQGWMQLFILGAVGAVAGVGGFLGNALGARLPLRAPQTVALFCLGAIITVVIVGFFFPGLASAMLVALVGSTASSLAKVCLDAVIQTELAEASRASAFGRSESVLQLSWVFGGVIGLLIGGVWAVNGTGMWALQGHGVYQVGFGIIGVLLIVAGAQSVAVALGRSLIPSFRRNDTPDPIRPTRAAGGPR